MGVNKYLIFPQEKIFRNCALYTRVCKYGC